MRRILILAVAVIGTSVVALPAEAKTVTIEAKDFKFVPAQASVSVGDTVVFSNTGTAPHNAQASDGSFKIDIINPGEKKSVVVTKEGTIPFVCTFHESMGMKATLTVAAAGAPQTEGAGGAPAPAAVAPSAAASEAAGSAKATPAAKPGAAAAPAAPEKPPTEKYFPTIALLLMALLAPIIWLNYRSRMKAAGAKTPAPPAPPAESAG